MDLDSVRNLNLAPVEHRYTFRDTILYALGLGYGVDPLDESELPFVYEENLRAVPSLSCVISHPGFWVKNPVHKIDWVKALHAEQHFVAHKPMPVAGDVRGEYRILGVDDKGAGKGSMMYTEKTLYDMKDNSKLATVVTNLFCRGDGGQGSFGETLKPASALPPREPNKTIEFVTQPSSALIYRLSGDYNPLHADPKVARQAGFPKPILHGLCTFGIACRAILKAYCGNDPTRLRSMFARFSSPVFPGETIRVEFYEGGDQIRFKASVKERNIVVLDRCAAEIAA
jgi:acyl dehydratase